MLDIEGIQKRLDKLDQYGQILQELRATDRVQFVHDYRLHGLAERYLHLSIECLLDISNMLVSGLGLRKPERAMFRLALERAGVAAEQALFIDDREMNVLAAQEAGLNAYNWAELRLKTYIDFGTIRLKVNGDAES